jgi:hypothetical protein
MAVVALVAAFFGGAFVDRVFLHPPSGRFLVHNSANEAADDVPMPSDVSSTSANSGAFTMQNCLLSATRRGMTAEQREYACEEIVN